MEKNKIARKKEWCYENVLLHVPHSSMNFPEGTLHHFNDLDEDERLLIDYYTDELFVPDVPVKHIEHAVFPYCRLYCDVERLINDPLEKEGLGISYNRRVGDDSCGYRSFSKMEDAFSMYVDFHSMVAKQMVMCGDNLLLIDCHSFSNLPNLLNSAPPDIDICIGYNDDEIAKNKIDFKADFIDNILHVEITNGEPFGPQPYLAIKTKTGGYFHDNFDFQEYKKSYTYVFDAYTIPKDTIDKIVIAVNDKYGNQCIKEVKM